METEKRLEQIYSRSEECIRIVKLDFSNSKSSESCYAMIKESGFCFDSLKQEKHSVSLRLHFACIPELLQNLKSQDGENYWILEDLLSLTLESR